MEVSLDKLCYAYVSRSKCFLKGEDEMLDKMKLGSEVQDIDNVSKNDDEYSDMKSLVDSSDETVNFRVKSSDEMCEA